MPNKVSFEYDPGRNILFTIDVYQIKTKQDVDEFTAIYQEEFERIDRQVNVVSNIDGLLIHRSVSEYYGQQAKVLTQRHCLAIARWGERQMARMAIKSTTRKASFETEVFESREDAAAAIERKQSQPHR